MNPENQQKPNFERIGFKNLKSGPIYAIQEKEEYSYWIKTWEEISEGKISYPDNLLLEELLKEHNLEAFLPDFKFLGFIWSEQAEKERELIKKEETYWKHLDLELLGALKYLKENKDVKIKINSLNDYKGITIKSPALIEEIFILLFEAFKKYEDLPHIDKSKLDWWKYIDYRLSKEKYFASKKGRKKESFFVNKIVYLLQYYLQEYTVIKAGAGIRYSNEQARIIFRFLEIYKLIKDAHLIERKEDTIGHYLIRFKKKE